MPNGGEVAIIALGEFAAAAVVEGDAELPPEADSPPEAEPLSDAPLACTAVTTADAPVDAAPPVSGQAEPSEIFVCDYNASVLTLCDGLCLANCGDRPRPKLVVAVTRDKPNVVPSTRDRVAPARGEPLLLHLRPSHVSRAEDLVEVVALHLAIVDWRVSRAPFRHRIEMLE